MQIEEDDELIPFGEVQRLVPVSRSLIYKWMSADERDRAARRRHAFPCVLFPRPLKLGGRSFWSRKAVTAWRDEAIEPHDDAEVLERHHGSVGALNG